MVNPFSRNFTFVSLLYSFAFLAMFSAKVSSDENVQVEADTIISPRTVQIAVTNIPYSLSPYAIPNSMDAQYSHLFFDTLVRWKKSNIIEYRLLDKLEQFEDNKTRFYLKKNIYFHSGNRFTTKDVIWSFNTALSNKYLNRHFKHGVKFRYINDYQFEIETQLNHSQLFDYMTHLYILDSKFYIKNKIKHDEEQVSLTSPIENMPLSGTGPYQVASFHTEINLGVQANPNYWGEIPKLPSLNFIKIKSMDSRLFALLAGDVDISESIPSKDIVSVQQAESKYVHKTNLANGLFLVINEENHPLLQRDTIRHAIHLAINQKGMLRYILHNAGRVDKTIQITPLLIKPPVYDAKRAKYLLHKIDMPEFLSLIVMEDHSEQTDEVVQAIKNMLNNVGIELQITEVNSPTEWHRLQSNYDLMLADWQSALIDTDNLYQDLFSNSYISKYIQSLFREQRKAISMEDKIYLFQQYQLSNKIIPLFSKENIWGADKQYVLQDVFSVNSIAYWHLLSFKE